MADELTELFRGRFTGHEMDVPAGAWEHISGQLTADGAEGLRESLQQRFRGHEVNVDPSAWSHITGQLGTPGAAGSTVGIGWIAAGVTAVAITAGVLLWGPGTDKARPQATAEPLVELTEQPPMEEETPPEASVLSADEAAIPTPDPSEPATEATIPPTTGQATEKPVDAPTEEAGMGTEITEQEATKPVAANGPVTAPAAIPVPETVETDKPEAPATGKMEPVAKPGQPAPAGTTGKPEPKPERRAEETVTESDTGHDQPALDPFGREALQKKIFIPNVFTPQGDGINDLLEIVVSDYESVDVKVYSTKNGALVFHTNDLDNQWDGRLPNGNNAEEGHYQCVVRVNFSDGRSSTLTELVRLYR